MRWEFYFENELISQENFCALSCKVHNKCEFYHQKGKNSTQFQNEVVNNFCFKIKRLRRNWMMRSLTFPSRTNQRETLGRTSFVFQKDFITEMSITTISNRVLDGKRRVNFRGGREGADWKIHEVDGFKREIVRRGIKKEGGNCWRGENWVKLVMIWGIIWGGKGCCYRRN